MSILTEKENNLQNLIIQIDNNRFFDKILRLEHIIYSVCETMEFLLFIFGIYTARQNQ